VVHVIKHQIATSETENTDKQWNKPDIGLLLGLLAERWLVGLKEQVCTE
jgi:hypothetical protein